MRIAKAIFAFLIVFSVALLPAVGSTAVALKTEAAVESTMAGMDCCPPDANPCANPLDGCMSIATCALNPFSIADASSFDLIYPVIGASGVPLRHAGMFDALAGSPPFRPPRV